MYIHYFTDYKLINIFHTQKTYSGLPFTGSSATVLHTAQYTSFLSFLAFTDPQFVHLSWNKIRIRRCCLPLIRCRPVNQCPQKSCESASASECIHSRHISGSLARTLSWHFSFHHLFPT